MKTKYVCTNMKKLEISNTNLAAVAAAVAPIVISQGVISKNKRTKSYCKPTGIKYENPTLLLAAGGGAGYRLQTKVSV